MSFFAGIFGGCLRRERKTETEKQSLLNSTSLLKKEHVKNKKSCWKVFSNWLKKLFSSDSKNKDNRINNDFSFKNKVENTLSEYCEFLYIKKENNVKGNQDEIFFTEDVNNKGRFCGLKNQHANNHFYTNDIKKIHEKKVQWNFSGKDSSIVCETDIAQMTNEKYCFQHDRFLKIHNSDYGMMFTVVMDGNGPVESGHEVSEFAMNWLAETLSDLPEKYLQKDNTLKDILFDDLYKEMRKKFGASHSQKFRSGSTLTMSQIHYDYEGELVSTNYNIGDSRSVLFREETGKPLNERLSPVYTSHDMSAMYLSAVETLLGSSSLKEMDQKIDAFIEDTWKDNLSIYLQKNNKVINQKNQVFGILKAISFEKEEKEVGTALCKLRSERDLIAAFFREGLDTKGKRKEFIKTIANRYMTMKKQLRKIPFHYENTKANGTVRINGLAMGRDLFSAELDHKKDPDAHRPDIIGHPLDKEVPYYQVIASDGFWNVFTNREVAKMIAQNMDAETMISLAKQRGSRDNITLVIDRITLKKQPADGEKIG